MQYFITHNAAQIHAAFHNAAPIHAAFHNAAPVYSAFYNAAPIHVAFNNAAPIHAVLYNAAPIHTAFHTQKKIEYFNADSRRSLKGKLINYLLLIFKFDLYVNPFLFRETASAKSL